MPLPPKPETVAAVVNAARDRRDPSPFAGFTVQTVRDVVLYLYDLTSAPVKRDRMENEEIAHLAPMEAKTLHVPHAMRVLIVQEARRIVSGDRSGGSFPNHTTEQVAGAIADLADILIATKEGFQKAQNRRTPQPRMSHEKVIAEVLQHGLDVVDWIEPTDLVLALLVLAKAPEKDNENLTAAHLEGVRILATAVKKLWPDLADEVVKRWMQYKAGEQQYLNELLEALRK